MKAAIITIISILFLLTCSGLLVGDKASYSVGISVCFDKLNKREIYYNVTNINNGPAWLLTMTDENGCFKDIFHIETLSSRDIPSKIELKNCKTSFAVRGNSDTITIYPKSIVDSSDQYFLVFDTITAVINAENKKIALQSLGKTSKEIDAINARIENSKLISHLIAGFAKLLILFSSIFLIVEVITYRKMIASIDAHYFNHEEYLGNSKRIQQAISSSSNALDACDKISARSTKKYLAYILAIIISIVMLTAL